MNSTFTVYLALAYLFIKVLKNNILDLFWRGIAILLVDGGMILPLKQPVSHSFLFLFSCQFAFSDLCAKTILFVPLYSCSVLFSFVLFLCLNLLYIFSLILHLLIHLLLFPCLNSHSQTLHYCQR